MAKINNMENLRDSILDTLEALQSGAISTSQAGVTGKLYESFISSLKTELVYSQLQGEAPSIKFLGGTPPKTINARLLSGSSVPVGETIEPKALTDNDAISRISSSF